MAEEQNKEIRVKFTIDKNSLRELDDVIKAIRREMKGLVEDSNRAATNLSRTGIGGLGAKIGDSSAGTNPAAQSVNANFSKGISGFSANVTKNLQQTRDYLKGIAGVSVDSLEVMTDAVESNIKKQTEQVAKLRNEFNLLGKVYKEARGEANRNDIQNELTSKGQELMQALGGGKGGGAKPPGAAISASPNGGMPQWAQGLLNASGMGGLVRAAGPAAAFAGVARGVYTMAVAEPLRAQWDDIRRANIAGQSAGQLGVGVRHGDLRAAYAFKEMARNGGLSNLGAIGGSLTNARQTASDAIGGYMGSVGTGGSAIGGAFELIRAVKDVDSKQVASITKRIQDEITKSPEKMGWVSEYGSETRSRIAAQRAFSTPSYILNGRYVDPAQRRINNNPMWTAGEQISMAHTLRAAGGYETPAEVHEALMNQAAGINNAPQLVAGAMMIPGVTPGGWMQALRTSGVGRDLAGDAGSLIQQMALEGYARTSGVGMMGSIGQFLQGPPGEAKYNAQMLGAGLRLAEAGPQDRYQEVVESDAVIRAFGGVKGQPAAILARELSKNDALLNSFIIGKIPKSMLGLGLDPNKIKQQAADYADITSKAALTRWVDVGGSTTPIGTLKQNVLSSGKGVFQYIKDNAKSPEERDAMLQDLGMAEYGVGGVKPEIAAGREKLKFAAIFPQEGKGADFGDVGMSSVENERLKAEGKAAGTKEDFLETAGVQDLPAMLAPLADVFRKAADGLTGPGGFTSELEQATKALKNFRTEGLGDSNVELSTEKAGPESNIDYMTATY